MGIYRGPGGSTDAVRDATSEAIITVEAKDTAVAAAAAAQASAAAATTQAGNAANSATAAAASATSAANSLTAIGTSVQDAEDARDAAQLAETNAETAETNAETAQAAAQTSATNAANSASAASTSATNAASSASAASTSATNASNSASAAATSATNASNSATAAQTSATSASNSASSASTSATNASNSASAAATSATNAANSATTATTKASEADASATAAAGSASAAATSASNAATSATNASNSASAASTSATNASSSANAAAASAVNAENAYDAFDDRYLGAKATAPTLDNDGNALAVGALYYNTTGTPQLYVWNGTGWDQAAFSVTGAVTSFNTRTGAVTLSSTDVTTALGYTPVDKATANTYTATQTFGTVVATTATLTNGTVSTAPSGSTDLVNKSYVDTAVGAAAAGIHIHAPVRVEVPDSVGSLNATYNNGTAGVGATLTNAGTQAALVIDGVTLNVNDRVLVYNQTNAAHNGVYYVSNTGSASTNWVLTRATDADSYGEGSATKLDEGSYFFVSEGNTGAGESYVCTTAGTITFGTTPINFTQFSSSKAYIAGTGLTLTNATFSITDVGTAGTYGSASAVPVLTTNAQGQVTGVTNTNIAIAAGAVSGLAASATTDTTNASNISSGTLAVARGGTGTTTSTGTGSVVLNTAPTLSDVVIDTNSNTNALRITQTGTGNAILVEDETNPDSTPFVVTNSGTVGIGTSSPAGRVTISEGNRVLDSIGNLNVFTTNPQAANLGGQIALGGLNGSAGSFDPWSFATIKGAKENSTSGNFAGYFAIATPTSGGTLFERMRIDSAGNVVLATGSLRQVRTAIPASDINLNTGNYFTRTISGATTFTVSNVPTTGTAISFILDLTNGGSATITWFSGVKWAGGTAPTLTSAGRDVLGFFTHDGGTNWTGLVLGKDVK